MRRLPFLLFFLICGSAAVRGQGQFQQTGGQANQTSGGGGSDFTQVHPNSGGDGSDFTQVRPQQNQAPIGAQQTGLPSGGAPNGGGQNGNRQNGNGSSGNMQGSNGNTQGSMQNGNTQNGGMQNYGSSDGESEGSSEINADDARTNFATVVEAYVAKKSPNGYWSYADKSGGKPAKSMRLTKPSVIEGSVKRKTGSRFSGQVKLRDARGGSITLKFVVDFSGEKWRVISAMPSEPAQ